MQKRTALISALWIALSGALLVSASFLFTPSETGNQVWFGYSAVKLGLFGAFFLLAAGQAVLLWGVIRRRPRLESRLLRLFSFFQPRSYRQMFYFLAGLLAALTLVFLWASGYSRPIQRFSPWIPVIHQQASQAMALAVVYCLLLIGLMAIAFRGPHGRNYSGVEVQSFQGLLRLFILGAAILAIIIFLLVIFWLLLTRNSFSAISPFWFFENPDNTTPFRAWQLLLMLLTAIPLSVGIIKLKRFRLPLLLLLGYGLLLVFPLFLRYPVSRVAYNLSHHGGLEYTTLACQDSPTGGLIRDFDDLAAGNTWLETKPPGYLVPFKGLAGLLRWLAPARTASPAAFAQVLQSTLVYLGPLLSLLSLVPVYILSGQFLKEENRIIPALAALLMPNFLLMSGFADQYLLPLIFMATLWLGMTAVRQRSIWMAFLTGLVIYLALFVSFSLLPLLIVIFGWLALEALRKRSWKTLGQTALLGSLILLGVVVLGLLFNLVWEYDAIARWQHSLEVHRHLVRIKDPLVQLTENFRINLTEYAVFTGPPLLLLFLAGLWSRWRKLSPPLPGRKAAFLALVFLTFSALLLSGQNRAEVARLWLYLNPLAAMAAAVWLDEIEGSKRLALIGGYVGLQLCLAYFYNFAFFGLYG